MLEAGEIEEIELGEYIRTENGYIIKYQDNVNTNIFSVDDDLYVENPLFPDEEKIVNHSKNIIDLIEVGDYVNGYRILAMEDSIYENSKRILIYKNQNERYERWIYIQEHDGKIHTQDDIAEILTKEIFEANCYKVKEE